MKAIWTILLIKKSIKITVNIVNFFTDVIIPRAVETGISHWEEHTCIKFRQLNDAVVGPPHITFRNDPQACFSLVGRIALPLVGQTIGLSESCQLKVIYSKKISTFFTLVEIVTEF